jgi:hypothetical protein
VRNSEIVLCCINKSHGDGVTGQYREYYVIRDKAELGVIMRDKTCSAVKIETRCKAQKRSDIIETEKSKLTNRDHP